MPRRKPVNQPQAAANPLDDPTRFGLPANAVEDTSKRTRNAKTFDLGNGHHAAVIGSYLHYQASQGGPWQDVDLTKQQSAPGTWTMNNAAVMISANASALQMTERLTNISWMWVFQGGTVDGNGNVVYNGVPWQYSPTPTGVKSEATVPAKRGKQTYSWIYNTNAQNVHVDGDGNIASDTFLIPRATIIRADGIVEQAGSWQLPSAGTARFVYDDSKLPASAYPYVIDPTTTLTSSSPAFAYVKTSAVGLNQFYAFRIGSDVAVALAQWSTASIPAGSTISSASLAVTPAYLANANGLSLNMQWYPPSSWPPTTAAFIDPVPAGAASVPLASFTVNQPLTVPLSGAASAITPGGTVCIRAGLSSGTVTGNNYLQVNAAASLTLTVIYTVVGTLSGTVTNAVSGNPIQGATIALNDAASSSAMTDASGNYEIDGVTAGTYTATISKTGYVTATESVTITAGSTATGNYTLTPSVVEVDGSATLTQASTLSATATVIRSTSADLKQASSLAATANPIRTGSLTAAQASELTATATRVRTAAANLAEAATLIATAEKIPGGGQAFLKQASTLSANASVIAAGSTHAANSLSAPDDLTNTAWVASGLTATANSVTAPNGQPTAGTLIESATSGLHFTGQTVATPAGSLVSLGITAKAAGRTRFQLSAIDGGGHNIGVAIFDLSTGAVVSLTAGAISARMDDLGSGWYRCSLVTMTTDTTTGLRLFLLNPSANYSGDGVSGIDVWQAGLSLVRPLAQASSLTATATRVQSSGATLEQASELTASGVRVRLGVASLAQATTLDATATRVVLTSADLKQAASLSVTASASLSGVAALEQASTIDATANALLAGAAQLKQASTLTAAAIVVVPPPGSGDGRTLAVFTDSGQARATFGGDGRTTATGGGRTKASWTQ